jgi:hypothetical protein
MFSYREGKREFEAWCLLAVEGASWNIAPEVNLLGVTHIRHSLSRFIPHVNGQANGVYLRLGKISSVLYT